MRLIFYLLLLIFLFTITPVSVKASDQFRSTLVQDYKYDENGVPFVTQYISLTNRFSGVYATSYQFTFPGPKPDNISAKDDFGLLKITDTSSDNTQTLLTINFNQQVVGKGKTYNFILSYTGQPAIRKGQVWEISIPKLNSSEFFEDYQVNLQIPENFGKPAYIFPNPKSYTQNTYVFSGSGLSDSVIKAAFGDFQSFSFDIDYQLQNSSPKTMLQYITLPPDTAYQHLYYSDIKPPPENVVVDVDGNWSAGYSVPAKKTLSVKITGQVHIQPFPGNLSLSPDTQTLNSYLNPTTDWPVNDPGIRELVKTIKTPAAIYRYVVDTLTYNNSPAVSRHNQRRSISDILSNPQNSICTDFTDLFITLSRAAGIPARELNGFAYSTDLKSKPTDLNPDQLHAWPEYWDFEQRTWISVDPTWEKTTGGTDYFNKFDFNHLVFVIHGQSSLLPIINGLYSHIDIKLSSYTDFFTQSTQFTWIKPVLFLPFFSTKSRLLIDNPKGLAFYNIPVQIAAQNLSLTSDSFTIVPVLPPFSKKIIPVNFTGSAIPDFSAKYLSIQVGDNHMTYNIPANLFIFSHVVYAITVSAIIIGMAFIAAKAWSLYLQGSKRSDHIHRKG